MDHWTRALEAHWGGITAKLRRLDGEYDLNFMAETPDGAGYVLKAMRPGGCEGWLVEMQVAALDHITTRAPPDLPVPGVIAATGGATGSCACRMRTGGSNVLSG